MGRSTLSVHLAGGIGTGMEGGDTRSTEAADAQVPRITVPMHGLARYLRVAVEVDGGVLQWDVPRAFFGILPLGRRRIRVPVSDIDSAQVRRVVVRPLRLAVGATCVLLPILLTMWWAVAPLAGLGLWVILVALGPHLVVTTRSGRAHRVGVCFAHQIDADLYAEAVTDVTERSRPQRER